MAAASPKKGTVQNKRRTAAERAQDAQIERTVADEELSDEELSALAEDQDDEADDGRPSWLGEDGELVPVTVGKRGREGVEQVHIFTLDDVDYFIPKKPNRALLLKFWTEATGSRGINVATQNALISLLGKDALDRLAESPLTTDEDVAQVFDMASYVFFGAIDKMRREQVRISDPSTRGRKKRRG